MNMMGTSGSNHRGGKRKDREKVEGRVRKGEMWGMGG